VKCSMRNFANVLKTKDMGVKKLRFWGKILGTEKDYYVAEGSPHIDPPGGAVEQNEDDPDAMEAGGVNSYTYFVTTDLCEEWTQLPDLKPSEIRVARQIKKMMTGNLNAPVVTHPYFSGNEGVLLRAQIAQITSDTVLCVKGFLKREDPDDPASEIATDPEFQCPLPAELLKMQNWMHMQPHILNTGRTTHKPIEEETDENKDEVAKQKAEQEADPMKDQLRTLPGDGMQWVVKQAGDTSLYKNPFRVTDPEAPPGTVLPPRSYAVTYVRSLTWPGAVTVSRNGQFANIYVGYGLKAGGADFFLRAPPDVQDEPDDIDEQEEPQGKAEEEKKEDE